MASSRMQRWEIILSAYTYTIKYKPGKHLCNADALSRLPCPTTTSHDGVPEDLVMVINHLSSTSVNVANIKEWTAKDPVLSCVFRFLMSGWPDQKLDKDYQPYVTRKHELSTLDGVSCGLLVSSFLHLEDSSFWRNSMSLTLGISKMKSLAKSYVWWPGMDSEIEQLIKTCQVCQESCPTPAPAPLHPWEWPSQPWSRIHLDFAGPYLGHSFLMLLDAHSKWIDVHMMNSSPLPKPLKN